MLSVSVLWVAGEVRGGDEVGSIFGEVLRGGDSPAETLRERVSAQYAVYLGKNLAEDGDKNVIKSEINESEQWQ